MLDHQDRHLVDARRTLPHAPYSLVDLVLRRDLVHGLVRGYGREALFERGLRDVRRVAADLHQVLADLVQGVWLLSSPRRALQLHPQLRQGAVEAAQILLRHCIVQHLRDLSHVLVASHFLRPLKRTSRLSVLAPCFFFAWPAMFTAQAIPSLRHTTSQESDPGSILGRVRCTASIHPAPADLGLHARHHNVT
jgi:hypothetical protein